MKIRNLFTQSRKVETPSNTHETRARIATSPRFITDMSKLYLETLGESHSYAKRLVTSKLGRNNTQSEYWDEINAHMEDVQSLTDGELYTYYAYVDGFMNCMDLLNIIMDEKEEHLSDMLESIQSELANEIMAREDR